ncbi:hypothetical protein ACIGO8_13650 [Streptomyces sp. NPDC053493]|uniref:hypothetical protein n=1 Tax=Streptomyces sp. NPDC053493 TaxID=3365705 RepID=UPI0037D10879
MWRRKRPGLVVVALCLGGALTACGAGGDSDGYAAVGAGSTPKGAVPPSGSVTLVPLDPAHSGDPAGPGRTSSTSRPSPGPPGAPREATAPPPVSSPDTEPGTRPGTGPGTPATAGPGKPATTAPPTAPSPAPGPGTGTKPPASPSAPPPASPPPARPAALTLSAPVLTDTDKRWCENVTVTFRNTGGTAARSGTVEFATHVIGALGLDWATVRTSQPLPAPLAAGTARTHTYTVCVDSWRVPLGMHVDTRQVTASWQ